MRTISTTVYEFNELSDNAKKKAIDDLYYINVDDDWWENVYEDAAQIGLKLTGFDIGRGAYAEGDFTETAVDVAKAILENHGENTGTYKTAKDYMEEYNRLIIEQCQDDADRLYSEFAYEMDLPRDIDTEDIDAEFLQSLLEDYRIILVNAYDYLTSEEAILEAIEANLYEFTEEGKPI